MAWFADGYLGDDPDFDALLGLPADALGFQYAQHIVGNNLSRTLARDYRDAHESLDAAGRLDDMPVEVKYAVVRGFQVHDYFHILTGYLTDGRGEMALQAFNLAQRRLPYSSLWMGTLTSQMTFKHPRMTDAVMDCITGGWQRSHSPKPELHALGGTPQRTRRRPTRRVRPRRIIVSHRRTSHASAWRSPGEFSASEVGQSTLVALALLRLSDLLVDEHRVTSLVIASGPSLLAMECNWYIGSGRPNER